MGTGKFGTQYPAFGKRRKREKLIFISLASIAFLLLSVFVLVLYSRNATASKQDVSQTAPPVAGTITLFTPARDISPGTKIADVEFKEIFWPRNSVPDGAIREISQLQGMYAKDKIPYGEPIKLSNLTNDRAVIRTIDITPGMRAVTIEVNAKRGVEGWTLPGSRVDVVLTYMDDGNLTSKVVVENARVLSSGGDISTAEERFPTGRRKVNASPTVTLEVVPEDALKIETAQQLGTLNLHMRAPDDNRASGIGSIDRQDIRGGSSSKSDTRCQKGKMKIAGKQYLVDCDGQLVELND